MRKENIYPFSEIKVWVIFIPGATSLVQLHHSNPITLHHGWILYIMSTDVMSVINQTIYMCFDMSVKSRNFPIHTSRHLHAKLYSSAFHSLDQCLRVFSDLKLRTYISALLKMNCFTSNLSTNSIFIYPCVFNLDMIETAKHTHTTSHKTCP